MEIGLAVYLQFLQSRLSDTNANLVARSLVVASELATAMGPAWDRTARDFLKPALEGLADKKKQVYNNSFLNSSLSYVILCISTCTDALWDIP